jgi:hypothetical protein
MRTPNCKGQIFDTKERGLQNCVCVCVYIYIYIYIYIYLTAIGLTPGGSSTVHIYTHKKYIEQHNRHKTTHRKTQFTNLEECGPCPDFVKYTLAFALQLRKKHGKNSVRVAGECQLARCKQNIHRIYRTEHT